MAFTLLDIHDAQPDQLNDLFHAWVAQAASIDTTIDYLAAHTGHLTDVWQGTAADAAERRRSGLYAQISNLSPFYDQVSQVIARYLAVVNQMRAAVDSLISRPQDFQVNLSTGEIVLTTPPDSSDVGAVMAAGATLVAISERITEILTTMTQADNAARDQLRGLVAEQKQNLTTTDGSLLLGAAPVLADPAIQNDPAAAAKAWHSMNPLAREYLITNNPELVGSLNGVPSADRDRANRILMEADDKKVVALSQAAEGHGVFSKKRQDAAYAIAGLQAAEDKAGFAGHGTYVLKYVPGQPEKIEVSDTPSQWDTADATK